MRRGFLMGIITISDRGLFSGDFSPLCVRNCGVCLSVHEYEIHESLPFCLLHLERFGILHPSLGVPFVREDRLPEGTRGRIVSCFSHIYSSGASDLPLSSYGVGSFLVLFLPYHKQSFILFVRKCVPRERLLGRLFFFSLISVTLPFAKVCCAYLYLRGSFLKP